jgi:hypothetical protein
MIRRYPGAQSFPDDDLYRRLFFGREHESEMLFNQILTHRLVVVYARSGLGKTSLLNAGVAEKLRREGFIPLIVRVNDPIDGPLSTVVNGISASCKAQNIEYIPGNVDSLWVFFKTAEFWRDDVLQIPVLILDQFEELFTLQSDTNRGNFIDQLSYLVRGVSPPLTGGATVANETPPSVKIVLSLREDFLADLEELADRIPGILDERFRLLPLSRAAAMRALLEPAKIENNKLVSRTFEMEPDAIELILDFLEQRSETSIQRTANAIEPFQLQLICQRIEEIVLVKQRQALGGRVEIKVRDIGDARSLADILKDFYEEQIGDFSWVKRRRIRRLCSEYLISLQGRRLRMEETEIRRLLWLQPPILKTLVDRRLIRSDETGVGIYYELSHDSLVKPILESGRFGRSVRLMTHLLSTLVSTSLSLLLSALGLFVLVVMSYTTVYDRKDLYEDFIKGFKGAAPNSQIPDASTIQAFLIGTFVLFLGVLLLGLMLGAWSLRQAGETWTMFRRLRTSFRRDSSRKGGKKSLSA